MDSQAILDELKQLGTEQAQKTYRRHGVLEETFGVSYADLDRLQKRLKVNDALAVELWNSGNHDARILASRIVDPNGLDKYRMDAWAAELNNYVICDAFSSMAARSPVAQQQMEAWMMSDSEWLGRTGWLMLAELALRDRNLPDVYFEDWLAVIENEIHTRKNFVRNAMNSALIAIGLRSPDLREKAQAAAGRIGKVQVDHGQTSCKTPDAAGYIEKGWKRKAMKKSNSGPNA